MEDRIRHLAVANDELERRVNECLQSSQALPVPEAAAVLKEYRRSSQDMTLCDLPVARSNNVETRLWNAHSRINGLYRRQLIKLRKESPNKPVEVRKFMKQYLDFLKDSQRFYREFIQKLNAIHGPIPELQQITHQDLSSASFSPASPGLRDQMLLSCHQTLIYLGDLSRYRTAEKLDKDPTWGPAMGYYSLASSLRPSSGLAFHQQSVVAFEEGDHLRATYYLYRSIVAEEPHPNALSNLEIQYRKVTRAWDSGELRPRVNPRDRSTTRKAMLAWFIRMHSLCFQGHTFSGHDQLETELMSHLATELKGQTFDGTLVKICLVNFAAQSTAARRFQESPDHAEYMQSYFYYLELNLRTFSTVLDTWRAQLSDAELEKTQYAGLDVMQQLASKITDVGRHALPVLRLYSAWLLTNSQVLTAGVGNDAVKSSIHRFWMVYVESMSLFATVFPVQSLPQISYMLEEDVESIGFKPLESEVSKKLWLDTASDSPKKKYSQSVRQTADVEMLARVRELLVDGLLLAVDQEGPIVFDGVGFSVANAVALLEKSNGSSDVSALSRQGKHASTKQDSLTTAAREETIRTSPVRAREQPRVPPPSNNDDPEAQMSRMVDDLVGAQEGMAPPTTRTTPLLAEAFEPSRSPSSRAVQRMQSLSSLWDESPTVPRTPSLDAGMKTIGTPRGASARARETHSRNNSATSIASQTPYRSIGSSFVPTPPLSHAVPQKTRTDLAGSTEYPTEMHSPLLFGAGGGLWSTTPRRSVSNNYTPPNGQGG